MSKNKDLQIADMLKIKPIGENQQAVFDTWDKDMNQFVFGAAGTGKTFILLYKAFQDNIETNLQAVNKASPTGSPLVSPALGLQFKKELAANNTPSLTVI